MSTATTTRLCQYGHEDCYKHMNGQQVTLALVKEPGQGPTIDLLDMFEALPVVLKGARYDRGFADIKSAAEAIGIHWSTLKKLELGQEVKQIAIFAVLEWLGPMSREEWDDLRSFDPEKRTLTRRELMEKLRTVMRRTHDPKEIAKACGYDKPDSLGRRLRRMDQPKLANFIESKAPREWLGTDSVRLTRSQK